MVPQGIHESSSWNSSSQSKGKSHQFAPRPFSVQAKQDFHRPPAQEELENEAFNQHKFEAFGLQLKEKHGTVTPVEQERLGVLQAKMDDLWVQRMERAKAQPNLLEILIGNSRATQTTESRVPVQSNTIQARSSEVVQRRDRDAKVIWDVTHEVIPDDEDSLFGDDSNPFENEGIELHRGDEIVVDDEEIFQSRRGANQEISGRRESDKTGHLANKWLKLKKVIGREDYSSKGYVREETIKIAKGVEERRELTIESVDSEVAKKGGDSIHKAWKELRKKRRMSKGAWGHWESEREGKDKETSPSWDQIEEGYDVSKQLSNSAPKDYNNYGVEEDAGQGIFTAYDKESNTPIGIIVIENRATTKFPGDGGNVSKRWYLRWLIGHPTMKGAGGLLLEKALKHVGQNGGKAVWVESAPSAKGWYQSKGFEPLSEELQKEYNGDFEEGWDSVLMVLNL